MIPKKNFKLLTLYPNGANILAPIGGYYKLNADLNALTHTLLKTNWGIIGTSTAGGWSYDTDMWYDATNKICTITMYLMAGARNPLR